MCPKWLCWLEQWLRLPSTDATKKSLLAVFDLPPQPSLLVWLMNQLMCTTTRCGAILHDRGCALDCRETIRKVERLHQWDVLRANKAPFAFGLEPRVPFLDKQFLEVCMSLDPELKMVSCDAFLLLIWFVKGPWWTSRPIWQTCKRQSLFKRLAIVA